MTEEKGFRFFAKGTDLIRMVRRVPFWVIQGSDDRGYEKHSITGCAKLTEFRTVRPLLEFVGHNTRWLTAFEGKPSWNHSRFGTGITSCGWTITLPLSRLFALHCGWRA